MMKGLLSVIRKALPAKPAAKAAAGEEFDRRLAAFRKASGLMESCAIGFICSRTRRAFEFRFERTSPGELFTLASVRKPEGSVPAAARAAPRAGRGFNVAEFDLSGWACPFCPASNFVHCRCGINCCDPRAHHPEGYPVHMRGMRSRNADGAAHENRDASGRRHTIAVKGRTAPAAAGGGVALAEVIRTHAPNSSAALL
jgi:hypothetical protein